MRGNGFHRKCREWSKGVEQQRCPYSKERQRNNQDEPGHVRCYQVHKENLRHRDLFEEVRKIVAQEPNAVSIYENILIFGR